MPTDISSELVRQMGRNAERGLNDILMLQQKILQWLKERREQEVAIKDGIGEASFANLMKSIDRAHDEQISYCEVSKDVYTDMCKTGLLQNGALRTYTVLQAANSDGVMIFYGSNDQSGMNRILDSMDAMYGNRAELDKDSFEMMSEGKDIYVLEGISAEDSLLFASLVRDGYVSENGSMDKNGFPFSRMTTVKGGQEYNAIVVLDEDKGKLASVMGVVAGTMLSTQGPRILEQLQYQLKGRQERNIAIEEARKEQVIVDADNPRNSIHVTAKDYEFYKNNKVTEIIPRGGPLGRVYDIVEGMSAAVIIDAKKLEGLSTSEQQEVLHNEGRPLTSVEEKPLDIDIKESMRQMDDEQSVKRYLEKCTGVTVRSDSRDLDSIVKSAEKQHRQREKQMERDERASRGSDPYTL